MNRYSIKGIRTLLVGTVLAYLGMACAPGDSSVVITHGALSGQTGGGAGSSAAREIYVANALSRNDLMRDVEARVLTVLDKQYPNLPPERLLEQFQQAREMLHGLPAAKSGASELEGDKMGVLLNSFFAGATMLTNKDPKYGFLLTVGKELASNQLKESISAISGALSQERSREVAARAQLSSYERYSLNQQSRANGWTELWNRAQTDPRFALLANASFAIELNAQTSDNISTILGNNPDFAADRTIAEIAAKLGPDGVHVELADLKAAFQSQLADIRAINSAQLGVLKTIDARQKSLLDYLENQEAQKEAAQAAAQMSQLKVGAAKSAVFLLSTLAGIDDPKLGHEIQVVGDASIQLTTSIQDFVTSLPKLTAVGQGLSTAIVTGNIVGAAMQVFSLFQKKKGPSGPTPEEVILSQITALRNQIQDMREAMTDRFDRVDSALKAIDARLDDVLIKLGNVQADVDSAIDVLFEIQGDLNRLDRNLHAFLDSLSRQQLALTMNEVLRYSETVPGADLSFDSYFSGSTFFYTWGTNISVDQLHAGPIDRALDQPSWGQELANYPPSVNINYLAGVFAQRGAPWSAARLPNPLDWSIGAAAYAELADEWPMHARRITSARLDDLISLGRRLRDDLSGLAGSGYFKRSYASTDLGQSIAALESAIRAKQNLFVSQNASKLNGVDIWGGPDQALSFTATNTRIKRCDGALIDGRVSDMPLDFNGKYVGANNVARVWGYLNVPRTYVVADRLGLARLEFCISEISYAPGTSKALPFELFGCAPFPVATVRFAAASAGKAVKEYVTQTCVGDTVSPIEMYVAAPDKWNSVMHHLFVGSSLIEVVPNMPITTPTGEPALRANAADMVSKYLLGLQKEMHAQVLNGFQDDPGIRSTAKNLDSARRLLETGVVVGMPQALAREELLRGLLYGTEAVLDSDGFRSSYQEAAAADAITTNPVSVARGQADRRGSRLSAILATVAARPAAENADLAIPSLVDYLEASASMQRLVPTAEGSNVTVSTTDGASATFTNVTGAGVTEFRPILPAEAGDLPARFSVFSYRAFELSTTAAYDGPIAVCLVLPEVSDQVVFAALRMFHNDGSGLADVTIAPPDPLAPDFATKRLCGRVTTLSPFVVAQITNSAPSLVCSSVQIEIDATCHAAVPANGLVSASDPEKDAFDLNFTPAVVGLGENSVKVSARDTYGAISACEAKVTAIDATAPTLVAPPNISVAAEPGACWAHVDPGAPTATDNCGVASLKGGRDDSAPDLVGNYPVGKTGIAWTATDASGNRTNVRQSVEVSDVEPPTLRCGATVQMTTAPSRCDQDVATVVPDVSDNCPGVESSCVRSDGRLLDDPYRPGTTVITWTGVDASQNQQQCTQEVRVEDKELPSITCPAPRTVECADRTGVAFTPPPAQVSDNCAVASVSIPPPGTYRPGTTDLTYSVTDTSGNSTSCRTSVIVADTKGPVVKTHEIALSPSDHKLRRIKLASCIDEVFDACSGPLTLQTTNPHIVRVTSDERDSCRDRNEKDIFIVDGTTVDLRAERDGTGDGRVYQVEFEVEDVLHNTTRSLCLVTVPHDAFHKAVNSGEAYAVLP